MSSRDSNSSPGLQSAYRAMVGLAGNRTPSIEQSCLTETTDCPSEVSVITSISAPRCEDQLQARLAHEADLIQRAPSEQQRAARLSLPPAQLRALCRDRLRAEGISLSAHPYTQVRRAHLLCKEWNEKCTKSRMAVTSSDGSCITFISEWEGGGGR